VSVNDSVLVPAVVSPPALTVKEVALVVNDDCTYVAVVDKLTVCAPALAIEATPASPAFVAVKLIVETVVSPVIVAEPVPTTFNVEIVLPAAKPVAKTTEAVLPLLTRTVSKPVTFAHGLVASTVDVAATYV